MNRTAASGSGGGAGSTQKPDRKTVEKNRRVHMKQLCSLLTSLIPSHYLNLSKAVTQQDQIERAAAYIKQLKERIDELKVKKEVLAARNGDCTWSSSFRVPVVELRESSLNNIEVLIVSDLQNNIRLCDVISVVQEEGAEVVSTNISRVGESVFHTLHAQVKFSRVGVDSSRILQRLQELTCLPSLSL